MKIILLSFLVSCGSATISNKTVKSAIKKISPDLRKCVARNHTSNDKELITNLHFTFGEDGRAKNILVLDKNNRVIENDELRVCQAKAIRRLRYTKNLSTETSVIQPLRYRIR